MSSIGMGIRVVWHNSNSSGVQGIATALKKQMSGLTSAGSQAWGYPGGTGVTGAPVQLNGYTFKYIKAYWTGQNVQLDLWGPEMPRYFFQVTDFLLSLNINIDGRAEASTGVLM